MEIFRLLESTMADVQPGHSIKHLRRDQLLDNYEVAARTLQTLIRAKESEIIYRKDLIKMLEDSKSYHDNRLLQAKQEYQTAKAHIPDGVDLRSINVRPNHPRRSTTPPLPPPPSSFQPPSMPAAPSGQSPILTQASPYHIQTPTMQTRGSESSRSTDSDLHATGSDSGDSQRGSLDRRLSEFLKTFPNLTQTGMAPAANLDQSQLQQQAPLQQQLNKPTPGYYTRQPMLPTTMLAAPPSIELMRYPPPFFPRNDRGTN